MVRGGFFFSFFSKSSFFFSVRSHNKLVGKVVRWLEKSTDYTVASMKNLDIWVRIEHRYGGGLRRAETICHTKILIPVFGFIMRGRNTIG